MALARGLLLGSSMSNKKKLALSTETLRQLTPGELDTAVGGTSMFTFTCVCFNVGGNAPGINVQRTAARPHAPRPR
jgi:hypothetical protein